ERELVVLSRLIQAVHLKASATGEVDPAGLEELTLKVGESLSGQVETRGEGRRERLVAEHDEQLGVELLEAIVNDRCRQPGHSLLAVGEAPREEVLQSGPRLVRKVVVVLGVDVRGAVRALLDPLDRDRVVAVGHRISHANLRSEPDASARARAETSLVAEGIEDLVGERAENHAGGGAIRRLPVEDRPDAQVTPVVVAALPVLVLAAPDDVGPDLSRLRLPPRELLATRSEERRVGKARRA